MLSFVLWQDDSSAESDDDDEEVSQRLQAKSSGGSKRGARGALAPLLFLDQNEAEKNFLTPFPPPPPQPPLPEGLDSPLQFVTFVDCILYFLSFKLYFINGQEFHLLIKFKTQVNFFESFR